MVGDRLHIGIILDGNRRFAEKKKMPIWRGHNAGAKKVRELIGWCKELDVTEITLYSFSLENFRRPENEKRDLFKLFRENIRNLSKDKKFEKEDIKINFVGRIELFPKDITKDMKELMEKTKNRKGLIVNFAMAYGGRQEIVDAVKRIADKAKNDKIKIENINEEMISEDMYIRDEADMIIRPGGEKRVSNFLLWQSYYSEWYFTDKLWPEFTKKDFIAAINEFKQRERRFGR